MFSRPGYINIQARLKAYAQEVHKDVSQSGRSEAAVHRVFYGSPIFIDAGVSKRVHATGEESSRINRIQRRRALTGLPYENWTGPSRSTY